MNLYPRSHDERLVIEDYLREKNTWRESLPLEWSSVPVNLCCAVHPDADVYSDADADAYADVCADAYARNEAYADAHALAHAHVAVNAANVYD